jgi:hypothetical protein
MGLFAKLLDTNIPYIDWEMTPDHSFGTFESWGGRERVRSKNERIYYFFIDAWDATPKLCLMERGIKHARVVAEILAPPEMVERCVQNHGKVALFERTLPINQELKEWLITHVVETKDDTKVVPVFPTEDSESLKTELPGRNDPVTVPHRLELPSDPVELSEEDVVALVRNYDFADQERNPNGRFAGVLVDNGDNLTVSDRVTGLMWQRGGIDIMSYRAMGREIARVNRERFAGFDDWRMPSMAEALSLLEREKPAKDQYLHPCFSKEQPFVFVDATRSPGGYWFVDFKQGRAYWSSGTIPGGFGRLCRKEK